MRIFGALILVWILMWPCASVAQEKPTETEYDYYSLAISSVLNSASEASKLATVSERVKLLVNAAKILPRSHRNDAIRLLDTALEYLKASRSDERPRGEQRRAPIALQSEILTLYAVLDPEKAAALHKEFRAESESTKGRDDTSINGDWFGQFRERRAIADQAAKMALSVIETNPEQALRLVVQSVSGGTVSLVLLDIVQKLVQNGNRELTNRLVIAIGQALAANVTLDPSSLTGAALITRADEDMPTTVRGQFISFFMRSLDSLANVTKDSALDQFYVSTVFTRFVLNVRPVIAQYAPDQLLLFDLTLDQVAMLVPEKTKSQLEAFRPEKFVEPRDRLNDILKDANSQRRDLRLVRFISQLLRNESDDSQKSLDLAAEAVNGLGDADTKSTYTDLLMIARISGHVKKKKYTEAQQLAGSISSDETRAWTLLALSTAASKADAVFSFELINASLKALDKISPAPSKVELALTATAMFAKADIERAFDTFVVASRYANSSVSKTDPPKKPPVAFGLDVSIGNVQTKLGVSAERLADLRIDPALGALGTADWFRANEIADHINDRTLRLRLRLQFAEAVLARESKLKRDAPIPKALILRP